MSMCMDHYQRTYTWGVVAADDAGDLLILLLDTHIFTDSAHADTQGAATPRSLLEQVCIVHAGCRPCMLHWHHMSCTQRLGWHSP